METKTPAQKAKELVAKFGKITISTYDEEGQQESGLNCFGDTAKQCALIAVDEIIELHKTISANPINDKFWQEVKQEINKL